MLVNRRIVLAARPDREATEANFRFEEETLRPIVDGEALLQTLYLSLDPYMRLRMNAEKSYAPPTEVGHPMEGWGVTRVLESRRPDLTPGDIVLAPTCWQTHLITNGAGLRKIDPSAAPITTALGVLGMPGFTAYAGLLTLGRPQPGETVVVAAATGPVGSAVGQIAKLKGARSVGIAGGVAKCRALKSTFGFDVALDHRSPDFAGDLKEACPDGIDVYFENVGGAVFDAVLPLMNDFGRIPVCGLVGQYNAKPVPSIDRRDALLFSVLNKSLSIRGFIQREFVGQYHDFLRDMAAWVKKGDVRYLEDVVVGFDNTPKAFLGMLKGYNFGKLLVHVSA